MTWKYPPPIFAAADIDDGVVRMELAVGVFVRLLDALDLRDRIHRLDVLGVQPGGVADEAEDGFVHAADLLHLEVHLLKVADHLIDFLRGGTLF